MSLLNYATKDGLINVDVSELKKQVEEEYKNALGGDLDTTASTPQGRLIEAETAARANMLELLSFICNQINPNEACGQFLDSLAALTGCKRKGATRSAVIATISGQTGTLIPAGTEVSTNGGDIFYLENDTVIGENGTIDARFLSKEFGAVHCNTGELTHADRSINGWETVTNYSPATLGTDVESDSILRVRRGNTLYNGRSLSGDILSSLANVDNIESVYLRVNNGLEDLTIRGVTIKANTLYTCVFGGSDIDIATALYMKNSAGCGYTGNTQVSVIDPWTAVSYDIRFERPVIKYIDVKVYLKKDSGAGDINQAIKSAILDYQVGLIENVDGLNIGVAVSPFEIASAINIKVPGVYVKEVQIAFHGGATQIQNLPININEIARIKEEDIKLRFED